MAQMASKNLTIRQYLALSNLEPEIKSVLIKALRNTYLTAFENEKDLLMQMIEPLDGNLYQELIKQENKNDSE